MKKVSGKLLLAVFALTWFVAMAPAVAADEKSSELWAQRCAELKQGEEKVKTKHCEIFQRLSVKATKEKPTPQRVAEFAIGYIKEKKDKAPRPQGVLVLPLGIVLDAPMTVAIDGKDQMSFHIAYCQPDGCYAFMPLTSEFLTKMGKGDKVAFTVRATNGQNLRIEMLLKGFSKAFDKIKK